MASSTGIAVLPLVFRVIALLALAAAVALMVTNHQNSDEGRVSFKDLYAYRYVVASGVVGFTYTLLQLPFAVFYVATGNRMIQNGLLPEFDFYGDKVMSWFLATAVGAGFAVTYELKKLLGGFLDSIGASDEEKSKLDEFLNRGYISTCVLAVGFLCLATLSVISSLNRSPALSARKGFFG
uniref:CASP-like protein n=1 Tax=Kalanchoe fedtschenkoi TaxID=63787 RepID=A0A7N0U4X2_KALFE